MIFQNYLVILILIILFKKKIVVEGNKNIRIYETQNNYPRYLEISDNNIENREKKVLAFSGYKKGTISKYSVSAEEIELHIPFIEYDSNADIKVVKQDLFIMVWGKNTIIQIVCVNATSFEIIPTKLNDDRYYSSSYKIIVLPLYQTETLNFVIGWINNDNIYLGLFKLENNNKFTRATDLKEIKSDNHFISCIQMKKAYYSYNVYYRYDILCEYVNNNCKIYYNIYSYNFNYIKEKNLIYQSSKCAFDKVINVNYENYRDFGASCFLQDYYDFKCIIWEYINSTRTISLFPIDDVRKVDELQSFDINNGIKFMSGCFNWIEETDVSLISNNKFVGVCLTNEPFQNRKVQIAIIQLNGKKITYSVIKLDSKGASFPLVATFGEYLSVFYNIDGVVGESVQSNSKILNRQEGKNVFEIFDTLLCKSIEIQINQGNSINFSTKELIFFGQMDPLNKVNINNYSIIPLSFPKKEYLCIKGRHYSDPNDSSEYCGVKYDEPSIIFDYIYYSEQNDELGYKDFSFRGNYESIKKGTICKVKIKVCSIECAECDETFTNCIKCAKGYHQLNETKNNPTFKCYKGDIENYAYNEISNYYEKCYDTCNTCTKPKNYNKFIGIKSNQQCKSCKSNYLFQPYSSNNLIGNCVKECDPFLGIDDSETKCINCKINDKYHIKGTQEKCLSLTSISQDYYILDNDPYNIIVPCADGTARKNNIYECERVCDLNTHYWYTNFEGEVKCTDGLSCDINDRSIFVESNKQCVYNCMNTLDSYCVQCLINDLFLYNGKCIENCPIGYEGDYKTHTCIPKLKCITTEIGTNQILKKDEFDYIFNKEFLDYINQFERLLSNNVKIVKGDDYILELFKSDLCEYEVSLDYKISYINLTQCQEILVKKNGIKPYDILWIKVDFPKIIESTSFYYQAYNIEKEQIIDLKECNNIDINLEIDFPESIDYKTLKEFYNKGIALYNASDDFFNDLCFSFYDLDNNDVLISDRRNDYFLNYSFCDEHCETTLNFENNKINCKCQMGNNSIDINSSKTQNFKNEKIKNEHISCFKCPNVVFNKKNFKKNTVSIVLLTSNIFNVFAYSYFFFGDLKSILFSMRQLFQNTIIKANPPKKEKESKHSKWKNPQKFGQNINSLNSNVFYQTPSSSNSTSVMESSMRKIKKKDLSMSEIDLCDLSKSKVNNFSEKSDINDILSFISYEDLDFEEAKKLDKRSCSKSLSRIIGKKVIFFSPFSKSYKFESCSIKIMMFLLQLMIISALICLFFKDKFISERYKKKKSIGFGFTFKQMWIYCILIALITSFIVYIFCAIIDNGKNFKKCIQNNIDVKKVSSNIKKVMRNYKIKIIIFMILCFILMGLLWYYVSTFCGLFSKTQKAWFYSLLISIFFILIIQIFYAIILGCLRHKSLKQDNIALYNIIYVLI